jgi:hypothetical protein
MARGEHAIKAIKIYRLLEERNHVGITVDEIASLFQLSRRSTYRYLEFIELAGIDLKKRKIDGKVFFRVEKPSA